MKSSTVQNHYKKHINELKSRQININIQMANISGKNTNNNCLKGKFSIFVVDLK